MGYEENQVENFFLRICHTCTCFAGRLSFWKTVQSDPYIYVRCKREPEVYIVVEFEPPNVKASSKMESIRPLLVHSKNISLIGHIIQINQYEDYLMLMLLEYIYMHAIAFNALKGMWEPIFERK